MDGLVEVAGEVDAGQVDVRFGDFDERVAGARHVNDPGSSRRRCDDLAAFRQVDSSARQPTAPRSASGEPRRRSRLWTTWPRRLPKRGRRVFHRGRDATVRLSCGRWSGRCPTEHDISARMPSNPQPKCADDPLLDFVRTYRREKQIGQAWQHSCADRDETPTISLDSSFEDERDFGIDIELAKYSRVAKKKNKAECSLYPMVTGPHPVVRCFHGGRLDETNPRGRQR